MLLNVENLCISFVGDTREYSVVRDVDFSIDRGEIVGLVGESGSGKTVTSLGLVRLHDKNNVRMSGSVCFEDTDLLSLTERQMKRVRGDRISMIFQEPMTALDPVFTIGQQISATLRQHRDLGRRAARKEALDLLDDVRIPDPQRCYDSYPHQLSGGMRQRALIAIALSCSPSLLIADEPTTAVDVTIQAQLLDLLKDLARDRDLALLLITHDMAVVAETCERVLTMYAGELVEHGSVSEVINRPKHPYTKMLLETIPRPPDRKRPLRTIPGQVPRAGRQIEGCVFHTRCPHQQQTCVELKPALEHAVPGHATRCLRYRDLTAEGVL